MSTRIVEIHNRTDKVLRAIKNGQEYRIPPGRSHLRADILPFAKTQNPVPGTDDGMSFASLIAIVADTSKGETQVDPLDDLPQAVLQHLSRERLDRTQLPPDRQLNLRQIDYAPMRRAAIAVQDGGAFMDGAALGKQNQS